MHSCTWTRNWHKDYQGYTESEAIAEMYMERSQRTEIRWEGQGSDQKFFFLKKSDQKLHSESVIMFMQKKTIEGSLRISDVCLFIYQVHGFSWSPTSHDRIFGITIQFSAYSSELLVMCFLCLGHDLPGSSMYAPVYNPANPNTTPVIFHMLL